MQLFQPLLKICKSGGLTFLFLGCGILVEEFQVMGNGKGFIGFTFCFDPFLPNSISQVGPIIISFFQFFPTGFQIFFPFGQGI